MNRAAVRTRKARAKTRANTTPPSMASSGTNPVVASGPQDPETRMLGRQSLTSRSNTTHETMTTRPATINAMRVGVTRRNAPRMAWLPGTQRRCMVLQRWQDGSTSDAPRKSHHDGRS